MATFLRHKVSKQKKRFKKDGFDLDLAYITERLIAMGFPSKKTEGVYRNPINQVYKFYEHYHKDRYKLYNLCDERQYDKSKFHNRVGEYRFKDHHPPPLKLIVECCNDIQNWLALHPQNVAGINCKAGKGRTGLIICCYLLHSKLCKSANEALELYGRKRTKDGKGVTIASQQRYIGYYEKILQLGSIPPLKLFSLQSVILKPPPMILGAIYVIVTHKGLYEYNILFKSNPMEVDKRQAQLEIDCHGTPIISDIKIEFAFKNKKGSAQNLCHFWINTSFIDEDDTCTLLKKDIDVANKDKKQLIYKDDFTVTLVCKRVLEEEKLKQATLAEDEKKDSWNGDQNKKRRMSFYDYTEYTSDNSSASSDSDSDLTTVDESSDTSSPSVALVPENSANLLRFLDDYDNSIANGDSQKIQLEALKKENQKLSGIVENLKKKVVDLRTGSDKTKKENSFLKSMWGEAGNCSKKVKLTTDFSPSGSAGGFKAGTLSFVFEENEESYHGYFPDGTVVWFPKSFCEDLVS
eukprot:TRINITY_DN7271_c0_g1_i1.p1 TRINITY_DN7271_c0_g1~~TRINITY_DN7271_c0_g1_i1.p1  ORF type:complete len:521 (-),score=93.38 TRINITY_DN7271_c0_g1_i1:100-1662(-)